MAAVEDGPFYREKRTSTRAPFICVMTRKTGKQTQGSGQDQAWTSNPVRDIQVAFLEEATSGMHLEG